MLSMQVKPIDNPKYYFDKENYYFTNQLVTQWVGEGALRQQLLGEIQLQDLEAVVSGCLPSGDIVGLQVKTGEINHRGGYDLTFSAPKSVSYLALVCEHQEFQDLHINAVKTVLTLIEKQAAEARKWGKEGMEYEKTNNLCFATILHDTSREQDPQLHIHALMMNFTQRLDGKWRALASDITRNHGTMEWVMDNQIFLGLVYRAEIAHGLKEMGLEIEATGDPHGLFEIKHFSQELMHDLSKRRAQVEEQVKGMYSNSLKAYDRATLDSRKAKEATNPEMLRQRWSEESLKLGVNPSTYLADLKAQTEKQSLNQTAPQNEELQVGVKQAIAHLEEKKLQFTYQELVQASLYFSLSQEGYEGIIGQVEREIRAHSLIALDTQDSCFTTPRLINKEKVLIEKLDHFTPQQKGQKCDASRLKQLTDNESIQKGVAQALSCKEGIVRIQQQSANSRQLLSTLIDSGEMLKKVRVLSPSAVSTMSINQEMKKSSSNLWQWIASIGKAELCETVAGFNYRHESEHKLPFFKNKKETELLIIDDSQRLSPDEMNTLLTIADKRAAKVILLEKSQALSGFKSDITGLLDKAQIKTISVDDRLKRSNQINLIEISEKEARVLKTAELYSGLSKKERGATRVLTTSKQEAIDVNHAIRDQLKVQGEVSQEEKYINTLARVSLTESEKKLAKSYKLDWVLIQDTRLESKKFTVLGVNEKDNQLILKSANGIVSELSTKNMTQSTQIYEQISLAVGVGDTLIASASRSFEGLKKGCQYEVCAFTPHGLKLKKGKQTHHVLTGDKEHFPLNYAYAKTMHASDFKPIAKTIISIPAYALRQNTLSLLSESTDKELHIITDDVDKANRYALKASSKESAISLTLEAAKTHRGTELINKATTQNLLITLEQAITLLTCEKPTQSDAQKALQFAITHLSEREAAFSREELFKTALNKAIGKSRFNELDSELDKLVERGELFLGTKHALTTKEAVFFEESIINTVKAGVNALKPLMSERQAQEALANSSLTKGQKEACALITTTSDQFMMIQGYAGTGKTTMTRTAIDSIRHVNSIASEGINIVALAPTHQAVKEMKSLGIEAQTLKSFLIAQEQELTLTSKSLILLDESSMVSNRDCANLVQKIKDSGARCALLGDISQHQSIESGKPSKILIKEGVIRTACMDDIVRQQVVGYKKAIETLIGGDTDKALLQLASLPLNSIERTKEDSPYHQLKASIVETGNKAQHASSEKKSTPAFSEPLPCALKSLNPIEMAVGDYLSRTPASRENTIVIIHENKKRELANTLIREALSEEFTLGSENKTFPRLISTNYTTAELYYCDTYKECLKNNKVFYLKKEQQYFKVVSVDEAAKVVVLHDTKGNKSLFIPEREKKDWKVELFQYLPAAISVGEKIHFKKSDKQLSRFANERVHVTEVKEDSFTVKDGSGKEHVLQKNQMKDAHWDYSYTSTSYSIQGASSRFVIGVAETHNPKVNHQRSFYIMATRGSLHAMIYTDDYETLQKQISMIPDKTSALESLGRLRDKDKTSLNTPSSPPQDAKNSFKEKKPTAHYDANTLSQHLSDHAESVIESLLGQPNRVLSSKTQYRYGTNGSLSFCLTGEKRGTWFNFETMEKGNMLHLIQQTLNLTFKEALEYGAKLTGDDLKEGIKISSKNLNEFKDKTPLKNNKTAKYALQLAKESKPLSGTVAEKYLKEIRAIDNVFCEDLRFHPRVYTHTTEAIKYRPALLNIARDKDHQVVAVEVVYLNEKTAEKATMDMKPKKSFGAKNGAGVILNAGEGKNSVTYLAEGVETGLSIRDAVKQERVIATLGKTNFLNINTQLLTEKVVLCLDNDGKPYKEDKVIIKAIERLQQHGKIVEIAIPSQEKDFNDIHKSAGIQGVITTLNKAVSVDKVFSNTNKLDMNEHQISQSLQSISHQMKMDIPENKKQTEEAFKTLQKVEMQI